MFALLTLFSSFEAQAGGLGLYTQAGMHQGFAYYYDVYGKQGIDSQFLPHYGVGIEGILGAREDTIKGLFRMAWNQDAPLQAPSLPEGDFYYPDENIKGARNDGLISIGLQWTLLGDPMQASLVATGIVTSAFWTVDSLEYFCVDVGIGGTYTIANNLEVFGSLSFVPRYRKQLALGTHATLGARVMFD